MANSKKSTEPIPAEVIQDWLAQAIENQPTSFAKFPSRSEDAVSLRFTTKDDRLILRYRNNQHHDHTIAFNPVLVMKMIETFQEIAAQKGWFEGELKRIVTAPPRGTKTAPPQ